MIPGLAFLLLDEQNCPILSMKPLHSRRCCKPVNAGKNIRSLLAPLTTCSYCFRHKCFFFLNLSVFLISFYRIIKACYHEFHSLNNNYLLSIYCVPAILNLFPIFIILSILRMENILYLVEECTTSLILG